MTEWYAIIGVIFLTLVGVLLGRWFAGLRTPFWALGYVLAAIPLFLIWLGRTHSQWELSPPFVWVCAGRTKFAIVGLLATMLLMPPLARVSNRRTHVLVWCFLTVFIWANAIWPFVSPAVSKAHHLSLLTRLDRDGICLQSTDYTCGPAAAVTALRRLNLPAEEGELTVLAHTCRAIGTPSDILWTTLRRRYAETDLRCDYRHFKTIEELNTNGITIAVIKYGPLVDHYVTVLEVGQNSVVVGDPLKGKVHYTSAEFARKWRFIGIVLDRPSLVAGRD